MTEAIASPLSPTLRWLRRVGLGGVASTQVRQRVVDALPFLGLGVALGLGLYARLHYVLASDFPLNDGGMFYAMVRDIQRAGYALPSFTSYNDASIPFAYPPFSFYLAALLDDLTPLSLVDVFRFLPLVTNLLTIVGVFCLSRSLLPSKAACVFAVVVFALFPRSFKWLIMGGGVSRSLGLMFAIFTIYLAHRLYARRQRALVVPTALLAALTVLSHPGVGWFLFAALALLFLCYGRDWQGVTNSMIAVVSVILLTAPWWGTVLARHGLEPFLAAGDSRGNTSEWWRSFETWWFSEQPVLNWPPILTVLGVAVVLGNGKPFLPLWLIAVVALEPRGTPTYATVPMALLVAAALAAVLEPVWQRLSFESFRAPTGGALQIAEQLGGSVRGVLPGLAVGLVLLYVAVISWQSAVGSPGALVGLTPIERQAMTWVDTNTTDDSAFVVITGARAASTDRTSEWFPALAGRASLATPQGAEWLESGYYAQAAYYARLQACAESDVACLDAWQQTAKHAFTHVYLAGACCAALDISLRGSTQYRLIFESPGARVFERNASAPMGP